MNSPQDDILELLRREGAVMAKKSRRGLIVQPGAIGDCILTLPLAGWMKEVLNLGTIDMLGHTEYIGILPERTMVDCITSIDTIDLHRLFVNPKLFDLADRDPLINVFAGYSWIVTFLGEPNSHFEQNLIFTANCTHNTEVITLPLKPPADSQTHLTDFYRQQFAALSDMETEYVRVNKKKPLIKPTPADREKGKNLLKELGIELDRKLAVIHPGSGSLSKCWHLENFLFIAGKLAESSYNVVFLLGPAEMERLSKKTVEKMYRTAQLINTSSLTHVLAVLRWTSLFIGNDSGITHLAAAAAIHTTAIFGPTAPAIYHPIGPNVTILKCPKTDFARKPSPKWQNNLLSLLPI